MSDSVSDETQPNSSKVPNPAADTAHMLLIRHAATAWNAERPPRLQGSGVDLELSPDGERQATSLATALAKYPLAKIYCSHLKRARQTATAIAVAQGSEVQILETLQEVHVGQWEGYTCERIGREFPEEYRLFWNDYGSRPYLGGESLAQVLTRAEPVLLDLLEKHRGQTFAVVAHGLVNRVFLTKHLGCELRQVKELPQFNCCVNLVRGRQGKAQILSLNEILHLEEWPE